MQCSSSPCLFQMAVVDICFNRFTICNGDTFGSLLTIMCMWSLSLSITSILKSDNSAMFNSICFMSASMLPVNILFLYLHTKMIWYLMRNFE